MLDKATKVDGWMTETELAFLYTIGVSLKDGANVVEVGSWKGRSTVAICEALALRSQVSLHAVDTFGGCPVILTDETSRQEVEADTVYQDFLHNVADYPFLKVVRSDSVAAADQFADNSIDWIFIDGDHSYNSVRNDVIAWYPKVKKGGWITGHDYGNASVVRAIRTLFDEVDVWATIWYCRKTEDQIHQKPVPLAEMQLRRVLGRKV